MIPTTDTEFEQRTIREVHPDPKGWSVTRDDGWSIFVTNENEKAPPVVGETIKLYGRGTGYTVRGIEIGGRVYRYSTPAAAELEHQEMCERFTREREEANRRHVEQLPNKPPLATFSLSDPDGWSKCVENNSSDPYSYACIKYASDWASLMESRLIGGATVAQIADRASHDADTDGITGFMYGAAVNMLAHCWKHGEELRVWHNEQYGVKSDSGTVNPAILSIG